MVVGDTYTVQTMCDDGAMKEEQFRVVEITEQDGTTIIVSHLVRFS